ncbi:hypothetical protein NQ176_g9344 [Zarea fungicola]|uniref:Uncharacterized protein n=1 Tax=Zarea fungicola TaxID=93591 RepID=A0ACC1MPA2_9HYPO|nr:hypothetical protein NQ176_g9344 [Lecanicillium fungicola]
MTRVYGTSHVCSSCLQPGILGWVYQCTQDTEGILDDAIAHGDLECYDHIGLAMIAHMNKQRSVLPTAKDKFSLLDQISPEQMANYRPEQIATLLRQKEKVRAMIQRERMNQNGASLLAHEGILDLAEPLPSPYEYRKLPTCVDRAYLSLDGVAKGILPPTAVTGFGFYAISGRPVTDARIVRNIGQHHLPAPTCTQDSPPRMSWLNSSLCLMDLLERQIACGSDLLTGTEDMADEMSNCSMMVEKVACASGRLTHSPPCNNLEDLQTPGEPSSLYVSSPESAFDSDASPLFDIPQPTTLNLHSHSDTETSYSNLGLAGGASSGNGFDSGISDIITAA